MQHFWFKLESRAIPGGEDENRAFVTAAHCITLQLISASGLGNPGKCSSLYEKVKLSLGNLHSCSHLDNYLG